MKFKKEFQYSIIFTTFLFFTAGSFAASFQGIGFLPGDAYSMAHDVSGDGSIVVGSSGYSYYSRESWRALKWQNNTITKLAGNDEIFYDATAISNDGTTIAVAGGDALTWRSGTISRLGDLPSSYIYSERYSISGDGSVAVGRIMTGDIDNVYFEEPLKWENGVMTTLGYLHEGDYFGRASGVSADGKVIVGYTGHVGISEAFMWQDGIMTGLGSLIPNDPFSLSSIISMATSISADGTVIVGSSHQTVVKWENGEIESLGMLSQTFGSTAVDVSADGKIIVGYCNFNDDEALAFIWDETNGMQNLQDLLVDTYGLDLTGWKLSKANAISADGTTIVGQGIDPHGNYQGWVVTIPEPATMLLFGLGGLVLRRKYRG